MIIFRQLALALKYMETFSRKDGHGEFDVKHYYSSVISRFMTLCQNKNNVPICCHIRKTSSRSLALRFNTNCL